MTRTVEDCAILLPASRATIARCREASASDIPDYAPRCWATSRACASARCATTGKRTCRAPDLARAMDAAIEVFRKLGAARRGLHDTPDAGLVDTKVVIAEARSIRSTTTISSRARRFRPAIFRPRAAGCLFQSSDYVQASREHRRSSAEVRPCTRIRRAAHRRLRPRAASGRHRTANSGRKRTSSRHQTCRRPIAGLPNGYSNGLPARHAVDRTAI